MCMSVVAACTSFFLVQVSWTEYSVCKKPACMSPKLSDPIGWQCNAAVLTQLLVYLKAFVANVKYHDVLLHKYNKTLFAMVTSIAKNECCFTQHLLSYCYCGVIWRTSYKSFSSDI